MMFEIRGVVIFCLLGLSFGQYVTYTFYAQNCSGAVLYTNANYITSCVLDAGSYYQTFVNTTHYTELLGCSNSTCDPAFCYVDAKPLDQCLSHNLYGSNSTYIIAYYSGPISSSFLTSSENIYQAYFDEVGTCEVVNEVNSYSPSYCSPYNASAFTAFKCEGTNIASYFCPDSSCSHGCVQTANYTAGTCYVDQYGDESAYFCGDATSLLPAGSSASDLRVCVNALLISLLSVYLLMA